MPKEYEAIRDSEVKRGKSYDEAQKIGAATYNKRHPDNPNPWNKEKKKGDDVEAGKKKDPPAKDKSASFNKSSGRGESSASTSKSSGSGEKATCPDCGKEFQVPTIKHDSEMAKAGGIPDTYETLNPWKDAGKKVDPETDMHEVAEGTPEEELLEPDSVEAAEVKAGESDRGEESDNALWKERFRNLKDRGEKSTKNREFPKSFNLRKMA